MAASLVLVAFLAGAPSSHAQPPSATAPAPSEVELNAARTLFSEALQDEKAGRLDDALAKFKRVREVRDTPAIEYRIGTCDEGIGHLVEARASYEAAIRLGTDPASADVVSGSMDRLEAISKRVALLTISISAHAPPDAEVQIDGARPASLADVPVDPGTHVVTARARGVAPFRSEVTLSDGGRAALTVQLDPPPPPEPPPPPVTSNRTAGWIVLGGGGALLVASTIVLVLREVDISSLVGKCGSDGKCPAGSNPDDLNATHDRAVLEGPLAAGLGIAGGVAVGVGLFLVLRAGNESTATVRVAPLALRQGAGIGMGGSF